MYSMAETYSEGAPEWSVGAPQGGRREPAERSYLFHYTSRDGLLAILKDGALKSSALTGLANKGYGAGLYESNEFVYMSAAESRFDPEVLGWRYAIYIHSAALRGRAFHVSTSQSASPDYPYESVEERKRTRPAMPLYSRSYPSSLRSADREEVLRGLYRQSVYRAGLVRPRDIQQFNQVAVRRSLDIRGHVAGISVQTSKTGFELDNTVAFLRKHHHEIPVYLFSSESARR